MYKITALFGIAMILSAFLFNNPISASFWISLVSGVVVGISSGIEILEEGEGNWEYWLISFAGIIVLASAFLIRFQPLQPAAITMLLFGGSVTYIAGKQFIANLL